MPRSYKHTKTAQRAHIPSREEAGYESDSPAVRQRETLDLPKNPVVHRGQDPELFWMNKYGADDADDRLKIDIRSLYRHEHIAPEKLIDGLHRIVVEKRDADQMDLFTVNETFGNALDRDELEKAQNRLIQGDSLLTMTSLLEREGMAGRVQMIYIDPPYGIKYNSNWQVKLNDRNVKDGADDHLSGEPEMIKAFRDTWELGIHSYLSYLRDRLLVAKELLTESGSCFVQIGIENSHLIRSLCDEVFGSENFIAQLVAVKTSAQETAFVPQVCDHVIFYAKNKETLKLRKVWLPKDPSEPGVSEYNRVELQNGTRRKMSTEEEENWSLLPEGARPYRQDNLTSARAAGGTDVTSFKFEGKAYSPGKGTFKTDEKGLEQLAKQRRLEPRGTSLSYVRFYNDFPFRPMPDFWSDVRFSSRSEDKVYVVQTTVKIIERCLLMTTDPGDLVLDPTCGSGTTAYVAEQWGRRWITIDTSRIALNIAKTRLTTAAFPYYHLHSDVEVRTEVKEGKIKKTITPHTNPSPPFGSAQGRERGGPPSDVRQGFVYEEVPHITLKSLANDEPPATETLYDKPYVDKKRLRVSGPFTVETLQDFEPVSPAELEQRARTGADDVPFEQRVFAHLQSAGVMTGKKGEKAVFTRVDRLVSAYLHAEGFYAGKEGERKAYFHIGPKFGTVSRQAVNEAIKECRQRGDADWLVILGFSFDTDITTQEVTQSVGSFMVTKTRMHDDLMQDGLMKKPKNVGSFITIGEPDVRLVPLSTSKGQAETVRRAHRDTGKDEKWVHVEIAGLDIYDPISDTVKARNVEDIAYWMVDDDYDGSNFVVKQVFFCGGDKDEFDKWRKGLSDLSKQSTKRKAERTLKIEIDDEAFDRLYGHTSHPIAARKGQKIAVRVVSQFGEESTKVVTA